MTQDEFWKLNEKLPLDEGPDALAERLSSLAPEAILAYEKHFQAASDAAFTWSLWGAAYLIGQGCSDDGFLDFRSGLIARGRRVYEAALENPDALADLLGENAESLLDAEEFTYAAATVYEEATGEESPAPQTASPQDPADEEFDFEDQAEMARRYPKLTALFAD